MKIDFLPKSRKFLAPPCDEVALHAQSISMLQADKEPDIAKAISQLAPDLATSLLYQYFRLSKHADFIQRLERLADSKLDANNRIKVLIIPGMFYREYPEAGGDGSLAKEVCLRNGFAAEIIQVNSRGSVTANKQIIRRAIMRERHANVWLVSISKGTADLRACLQEIPAVDFPANLRGWVNFSGIFHGSMLADQRINGRAKRLFLRTVCGLTGVDYQLPGELSTQHEYWRQPMHFLDKLELLHVIAFPLASHVQPLMSHRFSKLSRLAPTDGMINLLDTLKYPGHIYPIWGCDHFVRGQNISKLLYRLCHYMFESTTGENRYEDTAL
jgi:hypothetical protein